MKNNIVDFLIIKIYIIFVKKMQNNISKGEISSVHIDFLQTTKQTPQTSNDNSIIMHPSQSSSLISQSFMKELKFPKLFESYKENIQFSFNPFLKNSIKSPVFNSTKQKITSPKTSLNSFSQRTNSQDKFKALMKTGFSKSREGFNKSKRQHTIGKISFNNVCTMGKQMIVKNQENIKVYVRIKPLQALPQKHALYQLSPTHVRVDEKVFAFDEVFQPYTQQAEIFHKVATPIVDSLFEGYNGTIFAYGQTGSGKTYTMFGGSELSEKGLIYKTIEHIFNKKKDSKDQLLSMKCSILEIYKETLIDLFDIQKKDIKLKEAKKGIIIEGLSYKDVQSPEYFMQLVHEAEKFRKTASTKINDNSSRSHTILTIVLNFNNFETKMCLIDLAGSEKINKSGVCGDTLQQTKKINFSLSCLGNVINALTKRKKAQHIPFRDSKLTRILKDSLSGKFKTSIIVNCSAQPTSQEETLSSLKFAERAKKIKLNIKSNQKKLNQQSVQYLQSIIQKLTQDLTSTKKQLNKYKAICEGKDSILKQQQILLHTIDLITDRTAQPVPTARQIPQQDAYVSQTMKHYIREPKTKKIEISLSGVPSLNVSKSLLNSIEGLNSLNSPTISNLSSFREKCKSYINDGDISLSFSACQDSNAPTLRRK